ncbi:MAG: 3-phosphoshikimate 1-carboxyvinyltransferase [Firmicutes bacterium]|nr:3-phosphoshikimate 1-carboxyvinyltransferase [Bacillota bacterium]MBR6799161.1 3-phosphoshikimate 1-carboxyvinyltransferase [Bacillota bacterium]
MNVLIRPGKLLGTIDAMPSKSHAHRVLIAQKLAQLQGQRKEDALVIPSFSEDIDATKNCLVQLDKDMPFLDCKESGSTLRFMLPVAMALKDEAVFIGKGKLPERPISPLKEEMEAHGCHFVMGSKHQKISDKFKEICTITGRLEPGEYKLAGNVSSQFITGLLFALPLLDGDSVLRLTTKLESAGYVDLTLDVLEVFGIKVDRSFSEDGFEVYEIAGNQRYIEPDGLTVEGDWSNGSFWLVCGALGGSVTVRGLDMESSQRDKYIIDVLKLMGADIVIGDGITVTAPNGLEGAEVSVAQTPDMVPVLAAAMALAKGSSMITNAERLKIKESDRLKTVYDFLRKLGADITYGGSGLSLTGKGKLSGGEVDSHNDHRIAMAAAVASCGCRSAVTITNAEAVKKSYPDFFKDFAALGGKVKEI